MPRSRTAVLAIASKAAWLMGDADHVRMRSSPSGTASSSLRPPMPPNRPKPAHGLPCDPCRLVEAIGGGGTVTPPLAQLRVAGIAQRDQVAFIIAALFAAGDQVMVLQIVRHAAGGAESKPQGAFLPSISCSAGGMARPARSRGPAPPLLCVEAGRSEVARPRARELPTRGKNARAERDFAWNVARIAAAGNAHIWPPAGLSLARGYSGAAGGGKAAGRASLARRARLGIRRAS